MAVPIVHAIAEFGRKVKFRADGVRLETFLADLFGLNDEQRNRTSPELRSTGKRVWRNWIDYARAKPREAGWLQRSGDEWSVTRSGYEKLADWYTSREDCGLNPKPRRLTEHEDVPLKNDILSKPDSSTNIYGGTEATAVEGQSRLATHRILERKSWLAKLAKDCRLQCTGSLACDVCEFDFFRCYGDRGKGFIESHHRTPLGELNGPVLTRMVDLALVCANCHRMLHRKPWLTVEELRKQVDGNRGTDRS